MLKSAHMLQNLRYILKHLHILDTGLTMLFSESSNCLWKKKENVGAWQPCYWIPFISLSFLIHHKDEDTMTREHLVASTSRLLVQKWRIAAPFWQNSRFHCGRIFFFCLLHFMLLFHFKCFSKTCLRQKNYTDRTLSARSPAFPWKAKPGHSR